METKTKNIRFSPYTKKSKAGSASLQVTPIARFHTTCAQYQQPTELACFSFDDHRSLCLNSTLQLNWYYKPPNLSSCDLSSGFPDRYITRDPTPERLDALLDCLLYVNTTAAEEQKPHIEPDICTWRGILTKILCTPYAQDAWELGVTLYRKTIYIEEHEKRKELYGSTPQDKLMSFMGYKFESLTTIPAPPSKLSGPDDEIVQKRDDAVVNTNEQYCSVVKTRLGRNSIVMGAEVDCLLADSKPETNPQSAYAELKTHRVMTTDQHRRSFERHKLLKVWAQCFLPGIPTVIFGYKTPEGKISHIETLSTMSIPRMVRSTNPPPWDPTVCINFANAFLEWLRTIVIEDDPDVVYTVAFQKAWGEVRLLRKEKGKEGPEGVFIPSWYREGRHSENCSIQDSL